MTQTSSQPTVVTLEPSPEDSPNPPRHREGTLPLLRPARLHVPFHAHALASVDAAGATHVGRHREHNEDQFVIADLNRWVRLRSSSTTEEARDAGHMQGMLLAVADGMGGHAGGDLASSVAVDTLLQEALTQWSWSSVDDRDAIHSALEEVPRRIETRLRQIATRKGLADAHPGTTLTAAYLVWPHLFVTHVGDSRCYRIRDGEPLQLTRDHLAPGRSGPRLSQCIGGDGAPVQADTVHTVLQPSDVVLLCTDGLNRHVDDREIASLVKTGDASICCAKLIDAANAAGGEDNVTVVVLRIPAGEDSNSR